jgi:hypothetical protein
LLSLQKVSKIKPSAKLHVNKNIAQLLFKRLIRGQIGFHNDAGEKRGRENYAYQKRYKKFPRTEYAFDRIQQWH